MAMDQYREILLGPLFARCADLSHPSEITPIIRLMHTLFMSIEEFHRTDVANMLEGHGWRILKIICQFLVGQ